MPCTCILAVCLAILPHTKNAQLLLLLSLLFLVLVVHIICMPCPCVLLVCLSIASCLYVLQSSRTDTHNLKTRACPPDRSHSTHSRGPLQQCPHLVLSTPLGHIKVNVPGTRPCLQPADRGCFPCEAYPRVAAGHVQYQSTLSPLPLPLTTAPRHMPLVHPFTSHFVLVLSFPIPLAPTIPPPYTYPSTSHFAPFAMPYPYPVWKLFRGDVPERGPLRSGSYCGAALHGRNLMVLASAPVGARPERKDGGHPALCHAPPP